MDIQNVSGEAIALTKVGVTIPNGATEVGLEDKWMDDEDIAALVEGGKLIASNFSDAAGSHVAQAEVSGAVAASHTHANSAELDLVTDGDHDVSDGSAHSIVGTNQTHATGNGADHADVATNSAHTALVAGNPHVVTAVEAGADAAGSSAAVQGNLDTHTGMVTGNPHVVAPSELAYVAGTAGDWAGTAPADIQSAIDRIAAQVAVNAAAPIA